jgi:hypothetical protein
VLAAIAHLGMALTPYRPGSEFLRQRAADVGLHCLEMTIELRQRPVVECRDMAL